MHNLGTVLSFEIIRTLKKKSFWITSLAFPVVIAIVVGIIFFSNKATDDAAKDAENQKFSLAVTDDSDLIRPELLKAFDARTVSDKTQAINDVKAGKLDAYFYYPANLEKDNVEVYAKNVGIFENNRYNAVASTLMQESVRGSVPPDVTKILKDEVSFSSKTYDNGKEYNPIAEMIAPGIFLVLFYLMIATFGNQMLNSTTEEKENRVIEMILTTIESRTLILGKIISLIILGFIQMLIVLIPIVIGYIFLHDKLALPSLDLSNLPFDWARIGVSVAIFAVSFFLFTGLLVGIGAAAPTAKEAGGFFGVVMVLIFGPLYAAPLFISSPDSPMVQALSYFPFTAPIPLMLRNAVGNLELWQAGIAFVILAVTSILVMMIAVRAFRYGALEYSRRLTLKEILGRR